MTISDAFEQYRQGVIVFSGQSPKTEENHSVCLRSLLAYLGDLEIESVTLQMVRDWKAELLKKRTPETVRNYIIRLRVVLAYCQKIGVPALDPDLIPVPKRTDKVPTYIEPEDVQKLIDAALKPSPGYPKTNRYKNAAIVSLLYASGIRVGELCRLQRGDLRDGTFTVVGKGGKARLCFYDKRTEKLLEKYLAYRNDHNQSLFICNQGGATVKPGSVQEMFRLLSARVGMANPVRPHTLRHSFATNMLKNNTNLRYVQEFLGHSNIQTTQMYTHVVNRDLQKIYSDKHTI